MFACLSSFLDIKSTRAFRDTLKTGLFMLTIIKICLRITTSDLEKVTLRTLHNDPEDDFHRTRLLTFLNYSKTGHTAFFLFLKKDLYSLR